MKKIIVLCMILAVSVIGFLLFWPKFFLNLKKDTIYIAVAGPMSGQREDNGKEMVEGVRMCLEKIKDRSGFKDKKIELIEYDDNGKQSAIKIGTVIADEAKALLVLGHYDSLSSIAAGDIYSKNGIPAITASSTDEAVTKRNDWYFRIVPDQNFITKFIPLAIKELIGHNSLSVVYEENKYDKIFASKFEEETKNLGMEIGRKWGYNSGSEYKERDIKNIIGEIRSAEDPGVIYNITGAIEGVKFLSSYRYPGTNYNTIGLSSFSTPSFIERFRYYPKEKEAPGYYTDGIYAVSPFISYLGDSVEAREFRKAFVKRNNREPTWIAACYYDAMNVAATAINKAEIKGDDIRKDRRRVRKALMSINEEDLAINGITGDLFFDKDGDVNIPLYVGEWRNHMFIPAYSQYYLAKKRFSDKANKDDVADVEGQKLKMLRVVYAGCDVNKIQKIDTQHGTFIADFYLWFRFKGNFDDSNIIFENSISPLKLQAPIMQETDNGVTVRAYRVIGEFKKSFDKTLYPLDKHCLRISFRHKENTRAEMMYIPDVVGLPKNADNYNDNGDIMKNIQLWKSENVLSEGNIMMLAGAAGKAASYSQLNTEIVIERKNKLLLLSKSLFPMIAIIIFLYFIIHVPLQPPGTRMIILVTLIPVTIIIHLCYKKVIPNMNIVNYTFYLVYVLLANAAVISVATQIIIKKKGVGKIQFFNRLGKVIHIALFLCGGVAIAKLLYNSGFRI